ncbi:hypothetical protein WA026_002406 [Henosepilachna vigintioctopunctata]|uniref:Uncharacterized protein n=1 Tax=Henosepilachna vigintioctopunctata TaxID=420089 RepID=A0AAW1U3T1_9CUCU
MNYALSCIPKNKGILSKSINFLNNLSYHKECFCSLIFYSHFFKNYRYGVQSNRKTNYSTQSDNQNSEKSENQSNNDKLPPLMNFPKVIWPSLGKTIKNYILTTFIIKPYLDNDFNMAEVVLGSKKAVDVVSNKLSLGEIKTLDGLVASDIIPSLQARLSIMSLAQREQLSISERDIYFSFPYQVGIIFDDDDNSEQKRFVEITMVHHSLKGLSAMRARGEEIPMNIGLIPEYRDKISIANYRFIKEFKKGVESDWTINLMNHFRPSDEMDE